MAPLLQRDRRVVMTVARLDWFCIDRVGHGLPAAGSVSVSPGRYMTSSQMVTYPV